MSEVITTQVEKPVELTGTVANKRQYGAAVKRLVTNTGIAAKLDSDAAEAKRTLFRSIMDVRITISHEGRPDFGGNSGIWKSQVGELLVPVLEEAGKKTVDQRRTFMNSVVTNGLRALIMEEYIERYVEKETTHKKGTPAFVKAVRAEYTAAKRNIPTNSTYFNKEAEKGGPGKGDPKVEAPEVILNNAITAIHTAETTYDLLVMLNGAHRILTEAMAQLQGMVKGKKSTIPNRPAVRMILSDMTAQTGAGLEIAESKATEETYKTLALTAWTPTTPES